jgi:hypothetical protein
LPCYDTLRRDPIRIAEVDLGPGRGRIGVTFAPGKNYGRFGGCWARDLDADLGAIAAWGAKAVVTLLECQSGRCASHLNRLRKPA